MFRKRLASVLTMGLMGLVPFVVAADPAAAATSVTNHYINNLSDLLLAVALPITIIVEGVLFYAIWKFRKADEAKETKENRRLEITWTAATAVVLLFVGLAAYSAMGSTYVMPSHQDAQHVMQQPNTDVVHVDAYQWSWEFHYTYQGQNFTSGTLVLPANRQVVFRITSRDVIHSVHIPALGLKKDAIPGRTNYIVTKINPSSVGHTYQLYCAEFCGAGHSNMLAKVKVMNQSNYDKWAAQQAQAASSSGSSSSSSSNSTATSGNSTAPAGNSTATGNTSADVRAPPAASA